MGIENMAENRWADHEWKNDTDIYQCILSLQQFYCIDYRMELKENPEELHHLGGQISTLRKCILSLLGIQHDTLKLPILQKYAFGSVDDSRHCLDRLVEWYTKRDADAVSKLEAYASFESISQMAYLVETNFRRTKL